MKNGGNIFRFSSLLLLLIVVGFTSCNEEGEKQNANTKVVFIENAKVFDSFQMKKDYDARIEQDLMTEKQTIDSLGSVLNSSVDSMEVFRLRKMYFELEQRFNSKFEELSMKYTSEVNERLNEYVKEYSKEKGYDMVLGSSGQGNVMYVKEQLNVTKDLIKYINGKYQK